MQINIHRTHISEKVTDGTLSIGGQKVCNTAENTNYRIAPGTYTIRLLKQRRWGRKMPTLIPDSGISTTPDSGDSNVRKSTTPVIAFGNGVYNRYDYRILVGETLVPGVVLKTFETFITLFDRIYATIRRGKPVTVIITEKSL